MRNGRVSEVLSFIGATSLSMLLPAGAHAQSSAQADIGASTPTGTPTQQQAAFAEGVALLQEGRNAEALARLLEVRNTLETPAVLFNIALAHRGLGQYREAVADLDRYLELGGRRVDDARLAEVLDLRTQLRTSLARVRIVLTAGGATVAIDDETHERANNVLDVELNPGRHRIRVSGPGIRAEEIWRDVHPGSNDDIRLAVVGTAQITAINIRSNVATAEIYVDERLAGRGHSETAVSPGRHAVRIEAAGFTAYSAPVDVREGQTSSFDVSLVRGASGNPMRGLAIAASVVGGVSTTAAIAVGLPTRELRSQIASTCALQADGCPRSVTEDLATRENVTIAFAVTGGILTAGSVALFVVDALRARSRAADRTRAFHPPTRFGVLQRVDGMDVVVFGFF